MVEIVIERYCYYLSKLGGDMGVERVASLLAEVFTKY